MTTALIFYLSSLVLSYIFLRLDLVGIVKKGHGIDSIGPIIIIFVPILNSIAAVVFFISYISEKLSDKATIRKIMLRFFLVKERKDA